MDRKKFEETLKNVIDCLCETADEERRESEPYKRLFKLDGVGAVHHTEHEMTKCALDLAGILKDKYNVEVTNEKFDIIKALPFLYAYLEKDITKKEGMCCCVDKAGYLIAKYLLDSSPAIEEERWQTEEEDIKQYLTERWMDDHCESKPREIAMRFLSFSMDTWNSEEMSRAMCICADWILEKEADD